MHFSNAEVGLASSAYLAGAVVGALFFGWLTDRLGRKRLFFITLALYLVATASTALSWNLWSFALFRFFTGAGIGGEYTAINSTIQELVPARYRGWTDLVINGSFWIGAAVGAVASIVLLDPAVLPPDLGWRFAFLIGAMLGLVIFLMRMWLPEIAALADDAWPRRRSQQGARWHRGRIPRARASLRRRAAPRPAAAHAPLHPACGSCRHAFSRRAPAHPRGLDADGSAGVLLQRHLLHLRAGADRFLRHPGRPRRLVSAALRGRKLSRAGASRPAVRHRRTPHDDRR